MQGEVVLPVPTRWTFFKRLLSLYQYQHSLKMIPSKSFGIYTESPKKLLALVADRRRRILKKHSILPLAVITVHASPCSVFTCAVRTKNLWNLDRAADTSLCSSSIEIHDAKKLANTRNSIRMLEFNVLAWTKQIRLRCCAWCQYQRCTRVLSLCRPLFFLLALLCKCGR